MKIFLAIFLMTMCGCLPKSHAPIQPLDSADEVISELEYDMCFNVADTVYEAFPKIDECLEQVGLAWGIEIVIDPHCDWSIDMTQFYTSAARDPKKYDTDLTARITMRRRNMTIDISQLWVDNGKLVDMSEDDCREAGAKTTLRNVLLHEIGHALVYDGDHELGFMSINSTCDWLEPSKAMLTMARINPFWESL